MTVAHPLIGPHGAYAVTAPDRIRRVREVSDLAQLDIIASTRRLQVAVAKEVQRQRRRLLVVARLPIAAARVRLDRETNPGVRAALAARLETLWVSNS